MNKIIAIILTLTLTFSNAIAQRNPNTNANKINKNQRGDTIQKNQKLRNSESIKYENKGQAGAYLNYGTRSLSLPENEVLVLDLNWVKIYSVKIYQFQFLLV